MCLGAGITLPHNDGRDVVTDVNQTLLAGDVLTSRDPTPIPSGSLIDASDQIVWVYHDRVGYFFPPQTLVSLSAGPQSGKWSDIGAGSDEAVTLPVFDLWIEHGRSPQNGKYEYLVLPGISRGEAAERAKHPRLEVLSNSENIQAVYSGDLQLVEAVFRKPASLATPLGSIDVDHSCLVMVRWIENRWQITSANPENEPLTLNLRVNGQPLAMALPGGNFAGASASVTISAPTK